METAGDGAGTEINRLTPASTGSSHTLGSDC
jgi:hypothetical protein